MQLAFLKNRGVQLQPLHPSKDATVCMYAGPECESFFVRILNTISYIEGEYKKCSLPFFLGVESPT